ncbi:MAG TPA: DUF1295 domain-containing protein [Phnomibacter sp.]|nr:DUF1295 domain-containing protein [Phnomibacter sp.]
MLTPILLEVAFLVLIHTVVWYLISLVAKRNDVADIAWGLGFVTIAVYLYFTHPSYLHSQMLYALVVIWGSRLSFYIGKRNAQKDEDFRYRKWREAWGGSFYWRSFLQVFLLQGVFLYLIALPLAAAAANSHTLHFVESAWVFPFAAGWILWIVGFLFQSIADHQLAQFKKTKQPGQIMQSGLWRYSRHPNYFGEIVMWWGIYIMVMHIGWWTIISPVLITWLLTKVSGVPMLEKKYEGNIAYDAYKQQTNAILPWPRKRKDKTS